MIDMTTAQRDTLERKWTELDETTRPPLERFLESAKHTIACDNAVAVHWAGMWLCIERSGHAHS